MTDKVSNEAVPLIDNMSDEEFGRDRSDENPNVGKPLRNAQSEAVAAYGIYLTDGRFMDIASNVEQDAIDMAEVHYETGEYVVRPLYTHPAPQSEAVAVKALEWDDLPGNRIAASSRSNVCGVHYAIYQDSGRFEPVWSGSLGTLYDTVDEAKAAAQADFDQRIRSALTHPAPPLDEAAPGIVGLIERLAYRVGNPSAWDAYDEAASELMREAVAALRQPVQATGRPAPPLVATDEMVEFVTEAGGLAVATIEHDQYSLIEIVKSRSARNAACLTIHRVSDETGRRDDMSIDLTPGEAAKVAAALTAALEAKQ